MNVFTFMIFLISIIWFDSERVGSEIVSLCLKKVRREILSAVAVKPTKRSAKRRGRYAKLCTLSNSVSPARLRSMDGLVEEIVKQKVLKIRILAVRRRNVLQEN